MPRRQTFANQIRGQGNPVLLVDGGDVFFSSPSKKAPTRDEESLELRKARAVLNAYNFIGYQAVAIGPGDLQLGVAMLKEFEKDAKFPILCANLVDKATQKPLFKPSIVIEVGGIRFGIYAVLTRQLNETYRARVLGEAAEILDPEKATAALVPELRKTCDVVIALSHLNVDQNERLLETVPGIDVLIDPLARNGTKAIWVAENEYYVEHKGHPMLRIDGQGSRVGVFEMYFKGEARTIAEHEAWDGALEPHIVRHPEVQQLVQEFERGRAKPWTVDFDTQKPRLVDDFLGDEGCATCHADQFTFWKSTKHAATYATLEKTEDQLRMDCVVCHSNWYGVTFADARQVGRNKEVQCEGCHGYRAGHADNPRVVRLGAVAEDTCWGCHNPQITKKEFTYSAARDRVSCPKIQR